MARKPKRDLTVEEQLARGPLDLPFLMLTMLLLGVGLIMMFSASFATAYYNDGDPLVYIKNQAVYLGIKNGFDGHAQLHHAQVSGQMSAGFGDVGDQKLPDFPTKLGSLPVIQRSKVVMAFYFL